VPLAREAKEQVISDYAVHEGDTGSAEVQIALLTERIKELTEHLRSFPKDNPVPAAASSSSSDSEGAFLPT